MSCGCESSASAFFSASARVTNDMASFEDAAIKRVASSSAGSCVTTSLNPGASEVALAVKHGRSEAWRHAVGEALLKKGWIEPSKNMCVIGT